MTIGKPLAVLLLVAGLAVAGEPRVLIADGVIRCSIVVPANEGFEEPAEFNWNPREQARRFPGEWPTRPESLAKGGRAARQVPPEDATRRPLMTFAGRLNEPARPPFRGDFCCTHELFWPVGGLVRPVLLYAPQP